MSRGAGLRAAQDGEARAYQADVAADLSKAKSRGERLKAVIERMDEESVMYGRGSLPNHVRMSYFQIIADEFFGNAAVDIPSLGGGL